MINLAQEGMLNSHSSIVNTTEGTMRRQEMSTPFAPIIVTMVGIIAWLIFILLFALDWSRNYSLFQNIVVFIVSIGITAVAISIMWIVWGRNRWHWWTRQNWE